MRDIIHLDVGGICCCGQWSVVICMVIHIELTLRFSFLFPREPPRGSSLLLLSSGRTLSFLSPVPCITIFHLLTLDLGLPTIETCIPPIDLVVTRSLNSETLYAWLGPYCPGCRFSPMFPSPLSLRHSLSI